MNNRLINTLNGRMYEGKDFMDGLAREHRESLQ